MREQLLTKMIHLYGLEDPVTIQFAHMMEQGADEDTLRAYIEHVESLPFEEDE